MGSVRVWPVFLLAACGGAGDGTPSAPGGVWFEETAATRGVDFRHTLGAEQRFWFPEVAGSGLAFFDYDGDGDLDLYCVQAGELDPDAVEHPGNRLYANDGTGHFSDGTHVAGVGDTGYGMGCAVADYDADGDLDLYVTNVGPNVLYRNDGDGTFTDVTREAGVGDAAWGTSCAFLDYDQDGDLDLFVVNYIHWSVEHELECRSDYGTQEYCSPNNYSAPARDVLYRNEGGVFTDVSTAVGLGAAFGNGLGIVWGDVDGDGRVDVYVANDGMANQLWRGKPDGTFEDAAMLAGCAVNGNGAEEAGMGAALFDVDGDGDLDLFCTHLRQETNTIYLNERGVFKDATSRAGIGNASFGSTGFGVAFCDLDHDGVLDLFVSNGRVNDFQPHLDPARVLAEPDQLFRGLGAGRFEEIPRAGLAQTLQTVGRGAAFGDIDGDGDIDVAELDNDGPLRLFVNVAEKRGRWALLDVREADGRHALGATLVARAGAGAQHRQVQSAYSYCSSNDPRVHLGLGAAESIDEVVVSWRDGARETFGPLAADRAHVLRRGAGR
jgi:hypothetical protein